MAFMFEKLEVYQKAVSLADSVAALTQGFPRGFGFLADQLNRAALFVATNLAEGTGVSRNPTAGTSSRSRAAPSRNAYRCSKSPVDVRSSMN
jgi:hypothetical protein